MFLNFNTDYPEVVNLLLNANTMINKDMVSKTIGIETWQKAAKKVME